MERLKDFGIIISCYSGDFLFTKGTCASIRYFLGDVPICLIVDGDFSTDSLKIAYGVKTLYRSDVSHPLLKQKSFGWGLTKMVAFWESPWKHFLYLDSDTVVWGNVLKYADFDHYDVVIDRPQHQHTDKDISHYFFDTDELGKVFFDFDWQKHREKFFCTGTFFASRDIFDINEYLSILDVVEQNPKLFKYGEMGLLNFMLCRAEEQERIRIKRETIQFLVPDFDQKDLQAKFPVSKSGPECPDEDAVIHWAGACKPIDGTNVYSKPMSFARRKFLLDAYSVKGPLANVIIRIENFDHNFRMRIKNLKKKVIRWTAALKSTADVRNVV